jgi:hypothetical protein
MVTSAAASAPGLLAAVLLGGAARRGVGLGRWPGAARGLAVLTFAAVAWVAARSWVMPEQACAYSGVRASLSHGDMR